MLHLPLSFFLQSFLLLFILYRIYKCRGAPGARPWMFCLFAVFSTSWQEASFKEFAFTFEAFCVLICIDIFFLLSIKPAGWGMCYRRVCFRFFFPFSSKFSSFYSGGFFFFSCHKSLTMSYISELHVCSEPCVVWTVYGNDWRANERRFFVCNLLKLYRGRVFIVDSTHCRSDIYCGKRNGWDHSHHTDV